MVIFDFDKTLINKDTLFGFYKMAHGDGVSFKVKRICLLVFAVFYKFKIINNDKLKAVGIYLFLKGKTDQELAEIATEYARHLELNDIYYNRFLKYPKQERLIISASPEIYLHKVFPNEKIIGTSLKFKAGKVTGLDFNCYSNNKLDKLLELYPKSEIKEVYSDSNSDLPLFRISEKYYKVVNGKIKQKNG